MRGYLGVTSEEVYEFLQTRTLDVAEMYAPTAQFRADNADLDEEEIEYTLSMLAAEEAIDAKSDDSGAACVLAFEIPQGSIESTTELCAVLEAPLLWENLECLFEVSADGEELTWFATQEIENNIQDWLKK
jgi:hypothetical protein